MLEIGARRGALLGAVAVGLVVSTLMATATPAAAHGPGGLQPTNYVVTLDPLAPPTRGVTLRAVDLGERLSLTNTTATDVVVLGYEHEPYLRIGPRGVFENRRSPATYLNRSLEADEPVPARADATAAPRWARVGDGPTASWHDHRAHWMGTEDPVAVRRAPDRAHLVARFEIEVLHGDDARTASGTLRWEPSSSPWGWLLGALALAAVIVAASRTRRWATAVTAALVALLGVQVVHLVGLWGGSTRSVWTRLGAGAYAIAGVAIGVVALVALARRGALAAVPLILLAAVALLLAGGLADVTTLTRASLPTTLASGVDRATVALTLGLGLGLAAASAWRLSLRPVAVEPADPGDQLLGA